MGQMFVVNATAGPCGAWIAWLNGNIMFIKCIEPDIMMIYFIRFVFKQDKSFPETWLEGKCKCPTCRSKFCVRDVRIINRY